MVFKMKPILVVVHVYYPEMWPELEACLNNIPVPYDLYVTTVSANKNIKKDILKFNPKAHFYIVENRGYDVWPFIFIINNVDLNDYSLVIKLHTKRALPHKTRIGNGFTFCGNQWREELLKFIKNKSNLIKCINTLNNSTKIGCCASYKVIHPIKNYWGCDVFSRNKYKKYLFFLDDFKFVAGTMFIMKAQLLEKIQKMHITANLFAVPDKAHSMQFAHIMERTLGEVVYVNNMRIKDVFTPLSSKLKNTIKIPRFLFQRRLKANGKEIIRILRLPVFYFNYRSVIYKWLLNTLSFLHLISKKKYNTERVLYDLANSTMDIKKMVKIIEKSKFFDKELYKKQNPDVVKHKMNPALHYLLYGWKEERNPSAEFSTYLYLEANKDLNRFGVNPLLHYELIGKKEGRKIEP